jgi:hypothetical protein
MWESTQFYLDILLTKQDQTKWLNGFNFAFDKTPQQMIDDGFEYQVMSYLRYQVEGPY